MAETTIDLERSAYELLLARKKPDESLSEEIRRLLGSTSPSLKGFLDMVSATDAITIADAIEAIRMQEFNEKQRKASRGRHRRRA